MNLKIIYERVLMMRLLLSILQGNGDQLSSKRVFGIGSFIVAVILAFMGKDATTVGIFLGAASAVLIGQAISNT